MRIFISHSDGDNDLAAAVRERLLAAGAEVFDSTLDVLPGENWRSAGGNALERSDVVVLLLSDDAAGSSLVRHDIEYVIGTERFRDRVVPVLLGQGVEVPWIMRKLPHIQFASRTEDSSVIADEILKRLPQPALR